MIRIISLTRVSGSFLLFLNYARLISPWTNDSCCVIVCWHDSLYRSSISCLYFKLWRNLNIFILTQLEILLLIHILETSKFRIPIIFMIIIEITFILKEILVSWKIKIPYENHSSIWLMIVDFECCMKLIIKIWTDGNRNMIIFLLHWLWILSETILWCSYRKMSYQPPYFQSWHINFSSSCFKATWY